MRPSALALLLVSIVFLMPAHSSPYALTNGRIFDGVSDHILDDVVVLVANGRIERIANAGTPIPSGYEVIDLEGYYLMPGMFDVHTHIGTLDQARRALESGVTTVRSASVAAYQDVALQKLVATGRLAGPEVVPAGVYVTPDLEDKVLADPRLAALHVGVDTDEDLRLLVRVNADRGVGVIKTRGTERAGLPDTDPRQQVYTERQLRIVVEEATKAPVLRFSPAPGASNTAPICQIQRCG